LGLKGKEDEISCSVFSLAFLLLASGAQAQLYKTIGADGKVTYSDTPPATGNVAQKKIGSGGADADPLPYELAQAVKNSPVVFYSSEKCIPCDDGRKLLNGRGIPFTEKTIKSNEDIAVLRKITSEDQLPVLTIGRDKQRGFDSSAWNTALTSAGYPPSNRLPKGYRNAAPMAAAATSKPVEKAAAADADTMSTDAPPAAGNAPPGFRF
jgi:hypothetical protein